MIEKTEIQKTAPQSQTPKAQADGALTAASLGGPAAGLAKAAAPYEGGGAPVHLWDPPFCGDLDICIAKDGTWFYLGTPIGRPSLVKLFSSILKREAGEFFLVSPVEKVRIRVEDAPLFVVDLDVEGQGQDQNLHFTTKTDDRVTASAAHPLRVTITPESGTPSPYILVRGSGEAALWARIDRKTFYRMADLLAPQEHAGEDWLGLWSQGTFLPLIRCCEMV